MATFLMRGKRSDTSEWVTWTAEDAPDLTGADYPDGGDSVITDNTITVVRRIDGGGGAVADGAVTEAKIADEAVSGAKLKATDAAALRSALGLGDAAVRNTGIGGTQVVLGNDTRLSDPRTPTSHTHPSTDLADAGAVGVAVVQAETAAEARDAAGVAYLAGALSLSSTALALDLDAELGVTETSGRVSAWASQVGVLVAAQATAGQRPVRVAGAINGRSAIRFAGASSAGAQGEILVIPHSATIDWSALSVYVVARGRRDGTSLYQDRVLVGRPHDPSPTAPWYRWSIYQRGANLSCWTDGGSELVVGLDTGRHWGEAAIYELSVGAAGRVLARSGRLYDNNTSPTSVTYPNTSALGIGGNPLAGANEGVEGWRGDIARVLIYSAQHSAAEREAVLVYLSQRYGVALEG